jgi:hypothetical protein
MSGIERVSEFFRERKDLCRVFWLTARSGGSDVYGLKEDGSLTSLKVRKGFKCDDNALTVCSEVKKGMKEYSEVKVIGKEHNSGGEWVSTKIICVRGRKHVG